MLYNVSAGISELSSVAVRNHYNALDVQVLRKRVTRPADSGQMGGLPNIGGIGVLDTNDETDYEYDFLCNAHALKAEPYMPGNMTDRLDAPVGMQQEFVYLMVPGLGFEQDFAGFKNKDVVLFVLGLGPDAARLAFEVASVDATCELPPFLPRYVLNRRAHLDIPANFEPEPDPEPDPEPEPPKP